MTLLPDSIARGKATRAVVLPGSAPRRARRSSSRAVSAAKWVVLVVAILLAITPILYLIATSFKSPDDILSTRIFPARFAVENWASAMANW
ncbi:MAG: hypothetical protein ACTH0E_07170, partial [Candidatus Microbacterium stercoravium]